MAEFGHFATLFVALFIYTMIFKQGSLPRLCNIFALKPLKLPCGAKCDTIQILAVVHVVQFHRPCYLPIHCVPKGNRLGHNRIYVKVIV
jgi:hypothetical protein